jgi:hypothetical protein
MGSNRNEVVHGLHLLLQKTRLQGLVVCTSQLEVIKKNGLSAELTLEAAGGGGAGRVEAGSRVLLEGVGRAGFTLSTGLDVAKSGADDVDVENLSTAGSGEHDYVVS